MAQNVQRFLGGSPLAVLGRLILLSILLGVVLSALGLDLVGAIKDDLINFMRLARCDRLADTVGRDAAAVTAEAWPT